MGEFSPPPPPPLFLSPLLSFFFFSYPLNIEIIFDFSDIITKIHPLFQNPGSALANNEFEYPSVVIQLVPCQFVCNLCRF